MNEINGRRIKLSQLRALLAVAEHGNFSEAAFHLEISQSAVSHAIASLEKELGVILLSRGRHGAYLTPVGERVVNHARQMLQLLQAIEKEADLEKSLHGGSVRIACFRSVATHVLPAAIAQFRRRFPEITVSIIEANYIDAQKALREGRADICSTLLPTSDEFESWEIMRDEYVVLLPPSVKLNATKITWQQLAAYPLILPYRDTCYELIRQHLQVAADIPLNPAYEVKAPSTILGMVLQDLGAAIIARLSAEPIPPEIQVHSLPVPLERVIGVAVMANALQTPAVFAFLDILKSTNQNPDKKAV